MTISTPNPNSDTAPTPPPEVKQTWMPTTAGILTILAGAGDLLLGLAAIAWARTFADFTGILGFAFLGIPHVIIGIVAIIGGIFALQRRMWWLALVGAIFTLMWPSCLLGILSIIFVSLSKKEFK